MHDVMLGGVLESDLNHMIEAGLEPTLEGPRIIHSLLATEELIFLKEMLCGVLSSNVLLTVFLSLQRKSTGLVQSKEVSGPRKMIGRLWGFFCLFFFLFFFPQDRVSL